MMGSIACQWGMAIYDLTFVAPLFLSEWQPSKCSRALRLHCAVWLSLAPLARPCDLERD